MPRPQGGVAVQVVSDVVSDQSMYYATSIHGSLRLDKLTGFRGFGVAVYGLGVWGFRVYRACTFCKFPCDYGLWPDQKVQISAGGGSSRFVGFGGALDNKTIRFGYRVSRVILKHP